MNVIYISYPIRVQPVRLRKELDKQKIGHAGVSLSTLDSGGEMTQVAFLYDPKPEIVEMVDRSVQAVLRQIKVKVDWEKLYAERKLLGTTTPMVPVRALAPPSPAVPVIDR